MKKKFWTVLLVILVFVPSVVGIVSYFSSGGSPVNQNSISSVTMVDRYNEEHTFEKTNKKFSLSDIRSNMVQYFTEVHMTAKAENALPEMLVGSRYYTVTLNNYGRTVEYKYYFTEQPEYCYFLDDQEKCYSIDREYALAFLNSIYGRSIFKNATLPVMTSPAGVTIEPSMIKWTYLAADNMAPTYTFENNTTNPDVFNIAEQISVAFSIPADWVEVTVSDSEGELYTGDFDGLAYKTIPANKELSVLLNAKWYRNDDRQSEGEASYSFRCMLTDEPVFTLDKNNDDVKVGDFVNITARNVIGDPENILFSCEPALKHTPVFYKDRDYVRAILPIDLEDKAGEYTLTFTADGAEPKSIALTVEDRALPSKQENINSSALTAESEAAFNDAMSELLSEKSRTRYFDGEWIYPVKGSEVSSGYGRPTTTEGGYSYVNKWVRVVAYTGSEVLSMNAGEVVYVGQQTMTGNTVVVDHGLGIKTVYANMTSTSVNVGDKVSTGDVLGISGSSGYADGTTVSVAMVINGIYACPYEVWDSDGLVLTDE